jgi:phage terminase large subunit-like protein
LRSSSKCKRKKPDYSHSPVTRYAKDVFDGTILACKWVKLAAARHLKDKPWIHNVKNKCIRGLWFDEAAAAHVINFFPTFLCFYEGDFDGMPFILTPHQQFIVGSIFGWKRKDGYRRFRTAYIEESKGQGKSPLAGGVGLYGLAFDQEPGAEIYAAAVTREQAGILFRDARTFAEGSEDLKEILTIDKHNIAYGAQNSFFRPVSSEHRGLDGKRPHFVLIDEIHEHPNDIVVRKMSAGMKGRRQGLQFEITNSGYDRHSICYQHHEYTEKILEGVIKDDAWFGIMTGLDICDSCATSGKTEPQDGCPDCDDWRDENIWEKSSPNLQYLGAPFKDYLRRQVEEAKAMPSQENLVKRLNFCIWTQSVTKWLSVEKWNACNAPVDAELLKGRTCYGGLDLSSTTDVTAWVLVFPPAEEGEAYKVLCRFFIPEDNMRERVRKDRVPYDVWVRQGFIKATPGNIIDYAYILAQIEQDTKDYELQELAFDRWGSQKITTDLQNLGFEIEGKRTLIQFGQGFASMAAPTKELEKMVIGKEIAHGSNPVLTWMISNVVVRRDPADNMKVDKEKSTERVDGVTALVMAIARAMLKTDTASVYEDRGVLTF